MLVEDAQSAGLTVRALSGVPSGQSAVGTDTYTTEGVRLTVEGALGQITSFLDAVGQASPSLIPSLTSMTIADSGVAHAEIVFSTFEKVAVPTPSPSRPRRATHNESSTPPQAAGAHRRVS